MDQKENTETYNDISDTRAIVDMPDVQNGAIAVVRGYNREQEPHCCLLDRLMAEESLATYDYENIRLRGDLEINWAEFFYYNEGAYIKNGTYVIARGVSNPTEFMIDGAEKPSDMSDKEISVTIDNEHITFNFWAQELEDVEVENSYYDAEKPETLIFDANDLGITYAYEDELENAFNELYAKGEGINQPNHEVKYVYEDENDEDGEYKLYVYNTPTVIKKVIVWKEQSEQFSRNIADHPVLIDPEEEDQSEARGLTTFDLYDTKQWNQRDELWDKSFHTDNWEIVLNDKEKCDDMTGLHEVTHNDDGDEWTENVYSEWLNIYWLEYNNITGQRLYVAELFKKGPINWEYKENSLCYGKWSMLPSYDSINNITQQISELNNRVDEIAPRGEGEDDGGSSPKLVSASNTQFEVSTYNWASLYSEATYDSEFETGDILNVKLKTNLRENNLCAFQFRVTWGAYDYISDEYGFSDWWGEHIDENGYIIGVSGENDVKVVFTENDISIVCGEHSATLTKSAIQEAVSNEYDANFENLTLDGNVITLKYPGYSGMRDILRFITPYDLTIASSDIRVYDAGLAVKSYNTENTVTTFKLLETVQDLRDQIASLQSQIDGIKNGNV